MLKSLPNPARGFLPVYRENETNHCPGCGRSQWIVGRISAECVFCSTALPFQQAAISFVGKEAEPVKPRLKLVRAA